MIKPRLQESARIGPSQLVSDVSRAVQTPIPVGPTAEFHSRFQRRSAGQREPLVEPERRGLNPGPPRTSPLPSAPLQGSYLQHMAMDEQELPMGRPVGASSEEIASHDEEDFADALLDAVRPALRALRAMGLSEDDAADVLQDASIRAWRHRSQRRGEFAAWFVAIAYHEARRPHRRWPAIPVFWRGASDAPGQGQRNDDLDHALARLPRRQRTAISLRYGSDLAILDVATTLGISEPAARQLLARARKSLRRTMSSIPRGEA